MPGVQEAVSRERPGSALGQPAFRIVLYASVASLCAFWMNDVACSWLMREMTDADPFMTSLVQMALQLPVALVLLPAGVLTDLLDRVKLFLFAQLWSAIATAALFLCFLADLLSPIGLLALVCLLGIGSALRMPNVTATVSDIVPRAQLTQAMSLTNAVTNGSRMIGPAIAGVLIALGGVTSVIGVNLMLLLVAMFWLRQLPTASHVKVAVDWTVFKAAFLDGFRVMTAGQEQRRLLFMTWVYCLSLSVIVSLLPVLFDSSTEYGLMYTAYGAGAVCGAICMAALRSNDNLRLILRCCILLSLIALIVLALTRLPLAQGAALFLAGGAWVGVLNASQIYAALALRNAQRGRGMSFLFMAAIGGMALGSPIWGAIAKALSFQASFVISAVVVGALVLLFRLPVVEASEAGGTEH
jgi:MFS family permease